MQQGSSSASSQTTAIRKDAFTPGEVIAGKYVVLRVIGVGGVGVVLAARHVELDETVAIKFLLPEMQSRPDIVARFAGEAKAAVRIKSEYAARVFDVGVLPGRGPYLVMEYLEGENLGEVLAKKGPIAPKRAVELMLQVCEALAVAHSSGIIHRDIKPENLFLSRRSDGTEVMKVLDFGISKAALTGSVGGNSDSRAPDSMVKTQELMGTPLYMSPEQIRSTATVDQRSDIWSLGVVFYEMLTCQIPFPGDTVPKICARVLETEPPALGQYIQVSEGLQAVMDRCFQKDPAKRFQNVAELAIAILPFGPSRARVFAERASSILEASGQTHGVTFRFSSAPPASTSIEPAMPTIPGAPPTPRFTSGTHARMQSPLPLPSDAQTLSSTNPDAFDVLLREQKRARWTFLASMAMLIGLVGAGVSFFLSNRHAASPPPTPTASVAATTTTTTTTSDQANKDPAPVATTIGPVTITLGAKPADAKLYLDDTPLPSNPLKRTVMRDGQPHAVRAEALGYVTRSVAITFDSDKEIVLALDKSNAVVVTQPQAPPYRWTPPPSRSPAPQKETSPSPPPPVASPASPPATQQQQQQQQQPGKTIQEVDLPKTKKVIRPVDTNQPW